MPAGSANPYESPTASSGSGPFSTIAISPSFIAAVIFVGALFVAMLFTRGHFLKSYRDLGAELPGLTIIAMSPWSLIAVGLLLFSTIVKEFAIHNRSLARIWNTTACMLICVLGFFYLVALFLPFIRGPIILS